jgi:XTP/dITP diphosphohydrolase
MTKVKLVFATNNKHKFQEIKNKLKNKIELLNLSDIGFSDDIPETHETIEENALEKASFIYDKYKLNCFADDTGLEIYSLNGEPGVYSSRYAGLHATYKDNMDKVLKKLEGVKDRKAQFRTVISLIENGEKKEFEGVIKGHITYEKNGSEGFGYDPIFQPDGYEKTFAEMTMEEKNEISHRGLAVKKLINYLLNKYNFIHT